MNLVDMTAEQKAKLIPTGYAQNTPYTNLEDIRQMMMTKTIQAGGYTSEFTITNFRREDDLDGTNDGQEYYEVYDIKITVDIEDAMEGKLDITEQLVNTEKRVKEYKTLKGLIKGAVNNVRDKKNHYYDFTYLEL